MAIQTISTAYNPISGVFGTGQVQLFATSGTWSVPPGIGKVRARVWGGGGGGGVGNGGGFSLKAIYDLTGVTSVAVTVGAGGITGATTGGTSSFGSYCSATGGVQGGGAVGVGSGGDINNSGGAVNTNSGGGSASIVGNGSGPTGGSGGAGAGSSTGTYPGSTWSGFLGVGGVSGASFLTTPSPPTSGLQQFSIDFIGTGGGGGFGQNGINGGGGGGTVAPSGGIPGGGAGSAATSIGGQGLVIVEW